MSRPATLEEFADRSEIDALLNRYVTALDDDRFEMLDAVFLPDAHLSYADAGIECKFTMVREHPCRGATRVPSVVTSCGKPTGASAG